MNLQELYALYISLNSIIENYYMDNIDFDPYLEDENIILSLYHQILHGKVTRKDFLVFSVKDMLYYLKSNNLDKPKSSLLVKFERIYCK